MRSQTHPTFPVYPRLRNFQGCGTFSVKTGKGWDRWEWISFKKHVRALKITNIRNDFRKWMVSVFAWYYGRYKSLFCVTLLKYRWLLFFLNLWEDRSAETYVNLSVSVSLYRCLSVSLSPLSLIKNLYYKTSTLIPISVAKEYSNLVAIFSKSETKRHG